MIGFLTSISWIGWALIVLFGLTLWQLPNILREILKGNTGAAERRVQPGEDPPHLGPGAHMYANPQKTHSASETDPG